MNRDKKIACIIMIIMMILSASTTQGTTVDPLPVEASAMQTVLYLAGELRYVGDYTYEAYLSDDFQKMEEALYSATNDCEYLSQVADALWDTLWELGVR